MLFAQKYQIKQEDDLMFNKKPFKTLKTIAKTELDRVPHIILHGPDGSGRETLLNLYLQEMFGKAIWETTCSVEVLNKKSYMMVYSRFHWLFDFSMCGSDRAVITEQINQVIEYPPKDAPYRVIVIRHAEHLTVKAQEALKRVMETRVADTRFIFITNSIYCFSSPFISRCRVIKSSAPTPTQLCNLLKQITEKENCAVNCANLEKLVSIGNRHTSKTMVALQHLLLKNTKSLSREDVSYDDLLKSFCVKKYIHDRILTVLRNQNPSGNIIHFRETLTTVSIHQGNYMSVILLVYQELIEWLIKYGKIKCFDVLPHILKLTKVALVCDYDLKNNSNMKIIQLDKFAVHVTEWIYLILKKHANKKRTPTKSASWIKK